MKKKLVLLSTIILLATLTSCIKINITAPAKSEMTEEKLLTTEEARALVESIDESIQNTFNLNLYSNVTSASDEEVENFAKRIKDAYLNDDFVTLSNNMLYPINYDEEMKDFSLRQTKRNINDTSEFMEVAKNLKISKDCKEVFKIESCENLWADAASGGISLGNGFVYFRDVNFDGVAMKTIGNPEFKIISLSGLE